jgi:hypothetical protein
VTAVRATVEGESGRTGVVPADDVSHTRETETAILGDGGGNHP